MKQKQTLRVLDWLRTNKELTTREAVTELSIMSLPRRIMELRKAGYQIDMTYRTSDAGYRYGVYTLREEAQA